MKAKFSLPLHLVVMKRMGSIKLVVRRNEILIIGEI